MSLLSVIVLGLALGFILGGRPRNLLSLRFRWNVLLLISLAIQLLLFTGISFAPIVVILSYTGSLALSLIWLGRNLVIAGVPVALLGGLSNFLAIVVNGGYMPIEAGLLARIRSADYVRELAAGQVTSNSSLANSHTQLRWLTDVILIPPPWPSPTVLSIGDLLIAAGIVWLIAAGMRTQRTAGEGEERPQQVA